MSHSTNPTPTDLPVWPPVAPEQIDLLHDVAKRRAHRLREQAIDDLWDDALARARRAAHRLAARLRQHARRRAEGSAPIEA